MINKLKQKIFLIIMISLSIVILGMIILFSYFNYKNTLNTSGIMMDRFLDNRIKENEPLDNFGEKPENDEEIPKEYEINIDGLYSILIKNSEVIQSSDNSGNDVIEKYALKVANTKKETGIIENYIYKKMETREGTKVTLIEDETTINHLQKILIITIITAFLSLVIIYLIAKELSKTIVKPVEETLEKQKQFISDASHELKTPLAVIEANSDVLENEIGNNKWIKYIQNEIESMDKLINELLLLSKVENIDNIKEYSQINFSEEVNIVISMFESMAYEKKVKINSRIQENIKINCNKQDVEHILSTLIDNAIKHTKPEKEITVELKKEKNEIILQVKNMGEGIPEAEQEKIFERFYRVDKARNRNEKRYGLGLSIAKSTVEKYKGKISVSCKNGITTFKVTIPTV